MHAEDLGRLLTRFFLSGPLLYLGLVMMLDSARFLKWTGNIMTALRQFEQRFHAYRWQESPWEMVAIRRSRSLDLGVNFTGVLLAVISLVHLAGIV